MFQQERIGSALSSDKNYWGLNFSGHCFLFPNLFELNHVEAPIFLSKI